MTRTTQHDLEDLCKRLNDALPGRDYAIGGAYGGWRLESHDGSRDVSGYQTKHELHQWLCAFLKGIYEGRRKEH